MVPAVAAPRVHMRHTELGLEMGERWLGCLLSSQCCHAGQLQGRVQLGSSLCDAGQCCLPVLSQQCWLLRVQVVLGVQTWHHSHGMQGLGRASASGAGVCLIVIRRAVPLLGARGLIDIEGHPCPLHREALPPCRQRVPQAALQRTLELLQCEGEDMLAGQPFQITVTISCCFTSECNQRVRGRQQMASLELQRIKGMRGCKV